MSDSIKNIELQKMIGDELVSIYPKTATENIEGLEKYPVCDENSSVTSGMKIWAGTQEEYDALDSYSDSTLYLIKEE